MFWTVELFMRTREQMPRRKVKVMWTLLSPLMAILEHWNQVCCIGDVGISVLV